MPTPLEGRTALITGASSGFGEAIALTLAAAGARVAVAARREDRLQALVQRIGQAGGDAFALTADLSREDEAQRIVRETEGRFGQLDILVNNAGVMYLEPTAEADLGRWRQMVELNVIGLIAATQAALPAMRARRDGHIVNISSTAGRVAGPGSAGYAATKFGVVGFSEALRKELVKDRIRVTVIEPGMAATELRDHIGHAGSKSAAEGRAASIRQLESEDIANAVLYAVSQPPHVRIEEILMRPTDQDW